MKRLQNIKNWIIDKYYDLYNIYLVWTYNKRHPSFISYDDCQPLENVLKPIYWNRHWAQKERQLYIPEQVQVLDGGKSFLINSLRNKTHVGKDYVSGCLSSELYKHFSGDRGEVSMFVELNKVEGDFPAAWLLIEAGAKRVAEVDIFEWISQKPYHLFFTNHWGLDYEDNHEMHGSKLYFEPRTFKVALQWDENTMRWYLEDVLIKEIRNRYIGISFYLLLNLAVGGWSEQPNPGYKSNVLFYDIKGT